MSLDPKNSRQNQVDRIRKQREHRHDPDQLFKRIREQGRDALAQAITLVESTKEEDHLKSAQLLELCMPHSGKAWRIGITGVPGVGKSTFIETFGNNLTKLGHRVAVLAVDPSSQRSGGSILGDKTRMELLSRNENAFIRPSPASETLGGVARATRESIILCEAAGYDVILVETVGVGQSETTVYGMVDFFLLLMLAGAGDELQGIKRGIMEMADTILINKADGENIKACTRAQRQYKTALHLYPPSEKEWMPRVELCSGLENSGVDEFIQLLEEYFEQVQTNGWLDKHRKAQDVQWFYEALRYEVLQQFIKEEDLKEYLEKVRSQALSPFVAARSLVSSITPQGK